MNVLRVLTLAGWSLTVPAPVLAASLFGSPKPVEAPEPPAASTTPATTSSTPAATASSAKPVAMSGTPVSSSASAVSSTRLVASELHPVAASATAASPVLGAASTPPADLAGAPREPVKAATPGFVAIADVNLQAAYATEAHHRDSAGLVGSVLVLPAYKVSPRFMLLPIYTLDGSMYDQVIEENILYLTRQVHSISLGGKQDLGSGVSGRLSLDGAYALTQESRSDTLGKGLYDYYDLGGRTSWSFDRTEDGRRTPVTAALRVYARHYPEFSALAAKSRGALLAADPAAFISLSERELNPKDYIGYELSFGTSHWFSPAARSTFSYQAGVRSYTDRYLRTDQGLITSALRSDTTHRLLLGTQVRNESLTFGIDADLIFNGSNQSVYDADQPVRGFTPHYYEYASAALTPSVAWRLPFGDPGLEPAVRLGVTGLARQYLYRFAQDADGNNLANRQGDQELDVTIGGSYPLSKRFRVMSTCTERLAMSNNKFERYLQYDYTLFTASAGIAFSY